MNEWKFFKVKVLIIIVLTCPGKTIPWEADWYKGVPTIVWAAGVPGAVTWGTTG